MARMDIIAKCEKKGVPATVETPHGWHHSREYMELRYGKDNAPKTTKRGKSIHGLDDLIGKLTDAEFALLLAKLT